MILTRFSGETIATPQQAISVPSISRLKPSSVKSLLSGDRSWRTLMRMAVVRQKGMVEHVVSTIVNLLDELRTKVSC